MMIRDNVHKHNYRTSSFPCILMYIEGNTGCFLFQLVNFHFLVFPLSSGSVKENREQLVL